MKSPQFDVFSNQFSQNIFLQKYSMNGQESWQEMARRVVTAVCGQHLNPEEQEIIFNYIKERKFIPGGRYLYASGRPWHQISNCFMYRAQDSSEGWSDLMRKITAALMSGGGIGVDYSLLREEGGVLKRKGGTSTGPLALMNMVNESGRYIMQGGSRRSAVFAGLSWSHGDVHKFLNAKNWPEEVKKFKETNFNFPAQLDMTNISVIYDTEFFMAMEDAKHPKHKVAKEVWAKNCLQAFSTAEPGFSFNFCKDAESLRNACQPGFAKIDMADGTVKTMSELKVGDVVLNCNKKETVVLKKWSNGIKPVFAYSTKTTGTFIGTEDHKILAEKKSGSWFKIEIEQAFRRKDKILTEFDFEEIQSKIYLGDYEVFDITVSDDTHTYITNGVCASNCTEVTSEDDSDKCNLGTVWINKIQDKDELSKVVKYATKFLICGGIYSDVPHDEVRIVGGKNNRIGLGLGGMHEWLMQRGQDYEVTPELHKWLSIYEQESSGTAFVTARQLDVSVPKGVRAIAPTGSIGIIAETTTGIEPLFCKAYKRRYLKGKDWLYEYVVDGSVKRLLEQGVKLEQIKDAYDLSFKDRVKFQADVQNYVDMAISSTCNLPAWGSEQNNDETVKVNSKILLKYAKRLRGFTCYPDGARNGQPLTRVNLQEAMINEGTVFEEVENQCLNGVCGI